MPTGGGVGACEAGIWIWAPLNGGDPGGGVFGIVVYIWMVDRRWGQLGSAGCSGECPRSYEGLQHVYWD